jgi:hypothetical protein
MDGQGESRKGMWLRRTVAAGALGAASFLGINAAGASTHQTEPAVVAESLDGALPAASETVRSEEPSKGTIKLEIDKGPLDIKETAFMLGCCILIGGLAGDAFGRRNIEKFTRLIEIGAMAYILHHVVFNYYPSSNLTPTGGLLFGGGLGLVAALKTIPNGPFGRH